MIYRRSIIKMIFEKIIEKMKKKQINNKRYEELQYYLNLSTEELLKLDDMKLYNAIITRIENKNILLLSEEEKITYETMIYNNEINNGGLCQFFTNSSAEVAPYISNNLKILKATEHKKLYDNFIKKNKIDIKKLSKFEITSIEEFEKNLKQYPFNEFDNQFYKLQPLHIYINQYIKNNIEKF